MRLIIDIPNEAYDILTEYQVLPENIDLEYFVIHGIPLEDIKVEIQNTILEQTYEKGQIDVLEKIKAEIEEKQSKYTGRWVMGVTDYPYGCYRGYDETIKLIDNHISELKGSD